MKTIIIINCLLLFSLPTFMDSNRFGDRKIAEELGCEIKTIRFETAERLVNNYLQAATRHPQMTRDRSYQQRADNIHVCFSKAMEKTRLLFPEMSGVELLYGLESPDDSIDDQKLGIFYPLKDNGERYDGEIREVAFMSLPRGFTDPCPDWCD